ncbi:Hpt domain-containing protein [Polaromonas sp. YR568]|uniref:Hpt domain-containing protein n=1 Tax=Polaromonas sp. YR568 TaxID=1855301 RepID=UPI0031381C83
MSTPQEDFQKFLDQQRADYRRALPEKMAHIRALWTAVAGDDDMALLTDLERLVHTLAGTAGTLGFREVGAAARALELLLEQAAPAGQVPLPPQRAEIALAVDALQASLPADDPLS